MSEAAGAALGRGEVTVVEPDRRERQIARRSAEVRATVPSAELSVGVDMSAALARERALGCGTTALLVRACAHALRTHPRANGAYRDGHIELYSRVNIGVTIAADAAREIPTVFDADRKTAEEIGRELALSAQRARDGLLTAPELAGATFTLSDWNGFEIAALAPMVVAPQAGALAAGPILEQPLVRNGTVVAGRIAVLTLAVDMRILHGEHGARLLEAIKAHLEADTH
jgi:pyruvate dehydrogenase E2 component (dihydrolipoyllysine-residue acetyltransferase)